MLVMESDGILSSSKKRPKGRKSAGDGDKPAKGLRDFSYLVMSKVEQKGTTTYNEVSEELVEEIRASSGAKGSSVCD